MAYIRVDHSKFEATAVAVEKYIEHMRTRMALADEAVDMLAANWQGIDFNQFKSQWEKVTANGSTYEQMIRALEAYANYLRYAAKRYKDAQINAANKSDRLPGY